MTVCEVLPRERARWHNQTTCKGASLVQFLAVAVGFVTTTLITKYLGKSLQFGGVLIYSFRNLITYFIAYLCTKKVLNND